MGERPPTTTNELGDAARRGAATFVGAALSAALGFAFNVLLAREFGASGSGIVLQAIAVFTIALSLAKLGLDTTAVWLLPRLRSTEPEKLQEALLALLGIAAVVGSLSVGTWFALLPFLPRAGYGSDVVSTISLAILFLPAASIMTVSLAATRAFGGVVAFNAIGNVAVPAMRPAMLLIAVALGSGTAVATFAWSLPWAIGCLAALGVLMLMARADAPDDFRVSMPSRAIVRRILAYSLPRTLASALEQTLIWLDVLIVGIVLGAAAAGIYGSAARFVSVGVLVATALRIVVAPRFSALLAQGKHSAVESLYSSTARWILLFGAPAYILLAVFAPTVLGWLGTEFEAGALSMVILSLGSIIMLAAGNVQSLLLMAGRSGWGAFNKAVVLGLNVAGNLAVLPVLGISGAACVWVICVLVDTTLAGYQVRRATGISLELRPTLRVACAVALFAGAPALATEAVLGQGEISLGLATLLVGLGLLVYSYLDSRRLNLDELFPARFLRRRPG